MKNIFKFYIGEGYDKDNKEATSEIINEIENFKIKIREIINKYNHIGASDTQSREEIINFIEKELTKGGFI